MVISGEVEQVGNRVAGSIELGRCAEGLEASMGINSVASSIRSLRGCICLRDILYFGLVVDRSVRNGAFPGLLGFYLIQRFSRLELSVRGIGRFLGKLLFGDLLLFCLLYTSPSPRDRTRSRMPSSA